MKIKDIINEKWFTSFISKDGKNKDIFVNPSKTELFKIAYRYDNERTSEVGCWLSKEDMFVWNRYDLLHEVAKKYINAQTDWLPLHIWFQKNEAMCMVTDASRNTIWEHNPSCSDFVSTHPKLTKLFSIINVSYYDEDIVGDWKFINDDETD